MSATDSLLALLVAGALGFVVGLERQLSHRAEDGYAGARTFALYGLWGASAGLMGERLGDLAVLGWLAAFSALVVVAYLTNFKKSADPGTTTEAAAFVVFAIGVMSWYGLWITATGLTVAITALLRAKEPLHLLDRRFSNEDIRAVLQFGVVTAVVLPLVPNEYYGPFDGFNPYETWLMVVFVSAIGLAGYLALRLKGSRGLTLTGLLGGLVSSTAVTMSYSRMARVSQQPAPVLAAGVLAACGLMYARVLVEAAALAPGARGGFGPLAGRRISRGGGGSLGLVAADTEA